MPKIKRWVKGRFLSPRSEDSDAILKGSTEVMLAAKRMARETQHLRNLVLTNAPIDRHDIEEYINEIECIRGTVTRYMPLLYEGLGRKEYVPHTYRESK